MIIQYRFSLIASSLNIRIGRDVHRERIA